MSNIDAAKQLAAQRSLDFIQDGMIVGLGSGSTATLFIKALGEKMKRENLKIRGVASSQASDDLAVTLGIPVVDFNTVDHTDVTIDGADEVAPGLALIKGGGAAHLREKIVASVSRKFIIVADSTKVVQKLGKFPLPIEVIPMAVPLVKRDLEHQLNLPSTIRQKKDGSGPLITDEGNLILDCNPTVLEDPATLAPKIKAMVGVVEHGLFLNMANLAIIADPDGNITELTPQSSF